MSAFELFPPRLTTSVRSAQHAEHMQGPRNTLPMMTGEGPFGRLEMGGMFTVFKVRDELTSYDDPGWYTQPQGTAAYRVS